MNMAFPALCIVLIVLPGIIFRRAFTRGAVPVFPGLKGATANKLPTSNAPLTEEVSASLVMAMLLHTLWLSLCAGLDRIFPCWHVEPNYQYLLYVLFGDLSVSQDLYKQTLEYVAKRHDYIAAYFLGLYGVSWLLGTGLLRGVRLTGLDRRFTFFRLKNDWFYFLRGEMFDFYEFRDFFKVSHKITGTYVSVVVSQSDGDFLYKGFLWDFYLDRNGELDRLLLHNVIRRKFTPGEQSGLTDRSGSPSPLAELARDPTGTGEALVRIDDHPHWTFERISSQIWTVKYADCKTLACTYFYIQERPT